MEKKIVGFNNGGQVPAFGNEEKKCWSDLRKAFYSECVDDMPDGKEVSFAPHDLFEWFKAKLSNPSEFGLVKKEKADKLADALREAERLIYFFVEHSLSIDRKELHPNDAARLERYEAIQQALTEYEKSK